MAETANELHRPIIQKTCVLKASIHCEGCKRKVKKILTQVHGVKFVDVDIKQQKVTVTGDVEAGSLVKKLVKSGKHAEIWPEKVSEKEKQAGKTQKVIHKNQEANPTSDISHVKEVKPSVQVQDPESNTSVAEKSEESSEESIGGGVNGEVKVVNDPPPAESSGGVKETELKEPPHAAETSFGGEGCTAGKKKKKKEQNRNLEPPAAATPASSGLGIHGAGLPIKTNYSPPRQQGYDHYHTPPPPPVFGVSYNTAYPTSSYTASYYAAPPPYSSAYTYTGPETEPPPSNRDSHSQQPLDSFELFSDENPNGCTIT